MKALLIAEVVDKIIRENFQRLQDFYTQEFKTPPTGGFKHFEITVSASGSQKVRHGLGETPTDLWISYISTGTVTVQYNTITNTDLDPANEIYMTFSAPCTVRGFVGKYKG